MMMVHKAIPDTMPFLFPEVAEEMVDFQVKALVDEMERIKEDARQWNKMDNLRFPCPKEHQNKNSFQAHRKAVPGRPVPGFVRPFCALRQLVPVTGCAGHFLWFEKRCNMSLPKRIVRTGAVIG